MPSVLAKRPAASSTVKIAPDLLQKAKQIAPWLKPGDPLLAKILPDAEVGEDDTVSMTDYIDALLRPLIEGHHELLLEHITALLRLPKKSGPRPD